MLNIKTMRVFYLGCGYSEIEANDRAHRYIALQTRFRTAQEQMQEMAEEDEYKLQLTEKDHG